MNLISNILYWISTGLLVPVIVLLIFLFIRALVMVGTFFGQYLQQRRTDRGILTQIRQLTTETAPDFGKTLSEHPKSVVAAYALQITRSAGESAKTDLLINEFELDADRNIATSKALTKTGPVLGLMGTLIPMGPALVGLAQGDIASMAYNMQVAFATTVIGLVVSAVGFLTQQAKERWAMKNLTMLEYLADLLNDTVHTGKEAAK